MKELQAVLECRPSWVKCLECSTEGHKSAVMVPWEFGDRCKYCFDNNITPWFWNKTRDLYLEKGTYGP